MENHQDRYQQEVEEELPAKQQKVNEDQEEIHREQEHSAERFIEAHQAFEIFSALPIAHQHRLLPLWRSIYEDEPIPDEWTRWKIFEWSRNRWDPSVTTDYVQISNDGLSFNIETHVDRTSGFVTAISSSQFPPTRIDGPQICYFEAKHIRGNFFIGFSTRNPTFNSFGIKESGEYSHYLHHECTRHLLPNVAPIQDDVIATIGCGLLKHLGKLKIFFTMDGQLLAKPIPLSSTTPNELYPVIFFGLASAHCQFDDTNFGMEPFQFKYKGNEKKLMEEMAFD